MKIYVLQPRNGLDDSPWDPWYDTAHGFVVVARNALRARRLAATQAGYEGTRAWLDPSKSTCRQLKIFSGIQEGIVLRDFAAA